MSRAIAAVRPEAARIPGLGEQANWASTIVLMGLASVIYPQAIQRVYAARDGRTLRRSLALMSFMPLTTTLVVTWIGLAAIPRFAQLGAVEADRVMPLLLAQWAEAGPLSAVAATLVFLGALAAIMSTADSCLLSLGSSVAKDLLGHPHDDEATAILGKRVAAGVMIAMAALAMYARQVTLWGLIELKMELLIQCVPAFLVALHWPGLRAKPACWGLVLGTVIVVAGVLAGVQRIEGVHVGVIGLALNLVVVCAGSSLPRGRGLADPAPRVDA